MDCKTSPYISLYPCQMDITFTERCNQDCNYCWVDKSNPHVLNFNSIKKGIDIFLSFPLGEQSITFTVSEPLFAPGLYKKTIDYLLLQARTRKKEVNIVTTTNGINLNEEMRDFIIGRMDTYKRLRLNISIDGRQKSHDAHRKLRSRPDRSSFALSWRNFRALPRDRARALFTVTPSEIDYFKENIDFLLENGFRKIDIFPQVFTLWPSVKLKMLREALSLLIVYINKSSIYNYDLRILNRLWGSTHYNKLLLGCDGNFYLYEWVLAIPYSERKRYIIGNTKDGIDLKKRLVLFNRLFREVQKATKERCSRCSYSSLCSYPLPLFLRCHYGGGDFSRYFKNFCQVAGIFIDCSQRIKDKAKNFLDAKKLNKI